MRCALLPAVAAGTVFLCLSAPAGATTVSLTVTDNVALSDTISIDPSPVGSISTAATAFAITDTTGPLGDFLAWCLDLTASIGVGGPYPFEITDTPYSNSFGVTPAQESRIQAVFDANYDTLDPTDPDQGGAFQLSLWEALYDDDFSISNPAGSLRATSTSAIENLATTFLTNAANYSGTRAWEVLFLESSEDPRRQNLVTARELPAHVPLPAPALMLLAGLAALAAARRRPA